MAIPHDRCRKALFFMFLLICVALLAGFDNAQGAEDLVVAVDKSTMVKIIGLGIVGLLAEIWRNQRALFRITSAHAESLKAIQGYCKGKNNSCGE